MPSYGGTVRSPRYVHKHWHARRRGAVVPCARRVSSAFFFEAARFVRRWGPRAARRRHGGACGVGGQHGAPADSTTAHLCVTPPPPLCSSWLSGRAMASAGVASVAAGLLLCALLAGPAMRAPTDELAAAGSGGSLASLQGEVQQQLVEAAKRHADAEKHKTESVELANEAQREREQAALLKKRAVLAKSEAELEHAGDEVRKAHTTVQKLQDDAHTLLSTVTADRSKADKDRETVMELEDKAGALSQKASEEQDKVKLVEAKQSQAAAALPKLLKDAEAEEVEAAEMKAQARKRMADSQRKAAAAKRLDALALEKEHDAHVMRSKLMGILEKKTQILGREEKHAALADSLAKKAAQAAADKAQEYAAEAAEKAQLAESAASNAAPKETSAAPQVSTADKARDAEMARLQAEAEAADAKDDLDAVKAKQMVAEKAARTTALHVVAPLDPKARAVEEHPSRDQVHAARASNLQRAGLEAARRAAAAPARQQQLADVSQSLRGSEVGENEEGRLVVRKRLAALPSKMLEDGHYSEREEAFKRALAASYRAGYQGAERHAELSAETSAKPARFQMLGDSAPAGSDGLFTTQPNELLSAGAGSAVQLEKEGTGSEDAKAPLFSMLWTDPGSLKADTEDLEGTTKRMHRFAPNAARGPQAMPEMDTLYETGHTSRAESSFKKDMGKYRTALQEERQAHENKVKRLDEELAELPAAGRHTGDWKQDREAAFSTMLRQPQNQWNTHGEHAYSHTQQQALLAMPSVRQDEEGHLVFDKRRHARMQLLHQYAGRRVRFHEGSGRREDWDSSERADTVRRVKEELARERRRDRRLEDVTQRLQGEIDELREQRSGGARTEDLAQMRREREAHEDGRRRIEEDRRRRMEGARGRIRHYHSRAHGGGHGGGGSQQFHPDSTYNKEYAWDPGHVSVGEIKFQHALKDFDRTKSILREGAMQDQRNFRMPQLVPSHLPGQGLR